MAAKSDKPAKDNSELVRLLQELQLRFLPNSDLYNKLAKAIQLAQ
jgi:hypothetical protein